MALDTNWKLGVEYRHYDFDSTLTSTTFIDDSSKVGPTVEFGHCSSEPICSDDRQNHPRR